MGKSLTISIFIPLKLLDNHLAYCSLRNTNFLLLHTKHFDKKILAPFLDFTTFRILLSVCFFYILENKITLFYLSLSTFIDH